MSQVDKNLFIIVSKQWFDMIKSGIKTEDYRDIKPFWLVRAIECRGIPKSTKEGMCESLKEDTSAAKRNFNNGYCNNRKYETVTIKNGYSEGSPTIVMKFEGIEIKKPVKEWSEGKFDPDKLVFAIKIGKTIDENVPTLLEQFEKMNCACGKKKEECKDCFA